MQLAQSLNIVNSQSPLRSQYWKAGITGILYFALVGGLRGYMRRWGFEESYYYPVNALVLFLYLVPILLVWIRQKRERKKELKYKDDQVNSVEIN